MIGSDVIRGYSDTILLSLLAEGDSYGYQLSRSIRERSGGASVMMETTLYSAFARLDRLLPGAGEPGAAPDQLHHHRPGPGAPGPQAGGVAGDPGTDGPLHPAAAAPGSMEG